MNNKINTNKILLILCFLLCLTGCSSSESFSDSITNAIKRACNEILPEVYENNCRKTYYSYYLDKNIGKISGDEISNQFNIDGNISSLALDISSITLNQIEVGSDQYSLRNIGKFEDIIYSRTGRFFNSSGTVYAYEVSISKLDSDYVIMIQTNQFIFISKVTSSTCANTVHDMMFLLRTCSVDDKQVILDYASDSIVASTPNIITLFKDVVPESGYIIDYIDDWKDDKNFISIQTKDDSEVPEQGSIIEEGIGDSTRDPQQNLITESQQDTILNE